MICFLITNAFLWCNWFMDKCSRKNFKKCKKRRWSSFVANKISPRVVYTGSPPIFPNYKVPLLIEQSDGIIVADETCSANRMFNDRVAVDEWFVNDILDSISDKYLKACTCPISQKIMTG